MAAEGWAGVEVAAHFFPKFENTTSNELQGVLERCVKADGEGDVQMGEAGTDWAKQSSRGLLATLKHSGHLILLAGVWNKKEGRAQIAVFSKNSTGNLFTQVGEQILYQHFFSLLGSHGKAMSHLGRLAHYLYTEGLCVCCECVAPRVCGDHGATPIAAYLVVTTISQHGAEERFLSLVDIINITQRWGLPMNEMWWVPQEKVAEACAALQDVRWHGAYEDVAVVLSSVGKRVGSPLFSHMQVQVCVTFIHCGGEDSRNL